MAKKNETVGHSWAWRSDQVILGVIRQYPNLDRATLKKMISAEYPFGIRDMMPYAVWLKRVRYHLDCKFGAEPGKIPPTDFEKIWNSKIGS